MFAIGFSFKKSQSEIYHLHNQVGQKKRLEKVRFVSYEKGVI